MIKGANEMVALLKRVAEQFPDRVAAAIYQEAQIEMTEAKRRTPVDTGRLRASGTVHAPERKGTNISVTMSYGTDYAIYVHENTEAFHKVGQAKFLESVLNESRSSMAARIAARVDLNKMSEAL